MAMSSLSKFVSKSSDISSECLESILGSRSGNDTSNRDLPSCCIYCHGKGRKKCVPCSNGEVSRCPSCSGMGSMPCQSCLRINSSICPCCTGSGSLQCRSCLGKGKITYNSKLFGRSRKCESCSGSGLTVCRHYPQIPLESCELCSGKRSIPCTSCSGSGACACKKCLGNKTIVCQACDGTGCCSTKPGSCCKSGFLKKYQNNSSCKSPYKESTYPQIKFSLLQKSCSLRYVPDARDADKEACFVENIYLLNTLQQFIEEEKILHVAVCKIPLKKQKRKDGLSYHHFVVFTTEHECYSIEKHTDTGLTLQSKIGSRHADDVKKYFVGEEREAAEKIKVTDEGEGRRTIYELLVWLQLNSEVERAYDRKNYNCMHFAQKLFYYMRSS